MIVVGDGQSDVRNDEGFSFFFLLKSICFESWLQHLIARCFGASYLSFRALVSSLRR